MKTKLNDLQRLNKGHMLIWKKTAEFDILVAHDVRVGSPSFFIFIQKITRIKEKKFISKFERLQKVNQINHLF